MLLLGVWGFTSPLVAGENSLALGAKLQSDPIRRGEAIHPGTGLLSHFGFNLQGAAINLWNETAAKENYSETGGFVGFRGTWFELGFTSYEVAQNSTRSNRDESRLALVLDDGEGFFTEFRHTRELSKDLKPRWNRISFGYQAEVKGLDLFIELAGNGYSDRQTPKMLAHSFEFASGVRIPGKDSGLELQIYGSSPLSSAGKALIQTQTGASNATTRGASAGIYYAF